MKYVTFMLLIVLTTAVSGEDRFIVVLNKGQCLASRNVEAQFQDPAVVKHINRNKFKVAEIYGGDNLHYLRKHNIKWYPTVLKFHINNDGTWTETGRAIGSKNAEYWITFMGGNIVWTDLPKYAEEAKLRAAKKQQVQYYTIPQIQYYDSPITSGSCGPSG